MELGYKREADGSSSYAALLRAPKKKCECEACKKEALAGNTAFAKNAHKVKKIGKHDAGGRLLHKAESNKARHREVNVRTRLRESDGASSTEGTKFSVVLIQEGLGNFRDCFFYTKDCLKEAAESGVFEGKKCFADHPSTVEEQIQPERSTRDILGHFENVTYQENDDVGALQATLVLLEGESYDWARSLLTNSLEYATKYIDDDFVGLSINAQGEADTVSVSDFMQGQSFPQSVLEKLNQAIAEGVEEVRPVSVLKDAVSCDLVTEAGAGGKILTMMERNQKRMAKKFKEKKEHEAEGMEMEKKEAEHEAHEGDDGDGGAGGGDDADADQDKALFAKMIKQYLGDDADGVDQEEAMEMYQAAHEAAKEMGHEGKEAHEAAGQHLKMAMKMAKLAHEKSEAKEADDDAPAKPAQPSPAAQNPGKKAPAAPADGAQESRRLISANAELAKLREAVNALTAEKYLETKLKNSKRSDEFKAKFVETLGNVKSKAQIDSVYALFAKAYDAGKTESTEEVGFALTEKSERSGSNVISFADCAS